MNIRKGILIGSLLLGSNFCFSQENKNYQQYMDGNYLYSDDSEGIWVDNSYEKVNFIVSKKKKNINLTVFPISQENIRIFNKSIYVFCEEKAVIKDIKETVGLEKNGGIEYKLLPRVSKEKEEIGIKIACEGIAIFGGIPSEISQSFIKETKKLEQKYEHYKLKGMREKEDIFCLTKVPTCKINPLEKKFEKIYKLSFEIENQKAIGMVILYKLAKKKIIGNKLGGKGIEIYEPSNEEGIKKILFE